MRSAILLHLAGILVLLVLSAFFSGSEAAIFSLSPLRVRRLVSERIRFSGHLSRLLSNPQRTLISILLGNTLANVGTSFFAALLAFRVAKLIGVGETAGAAVGIGVTTFLLLVFGEISPKWYSLERAERVSLRTAPILNFVSTIFLPVSYILELFIRFGQFGRNRRSLVTMDEIKAMLELGRKTKTLRDFEQEIIGNVFDFSDTVVRETMTPRTEMFSISKDLSVSGARNLARTKRHSRMPVYDDNLDDIVGILYLKDILTARVSERDSVLNLLKPAYFVPETMRIGGLLEEFQRRRMHFAMVVDEHGGTVGLVTLDDVLKEIVGDITEESRTGERPEIVVINEKELVADGYVSLNDLKKRTGLDLPVQEFDTLSGLIYDLAGRIPVEGESFEYRGATYTIQEIQGTRISRVRIVKAG